MKKDMKTQADPEIDLENFECKTLEDFEIYNRAANRHYREILKTNPKASRAYKIRVPDESFHKKVKVKFQRFDQPENVLKVRVRTKEIDWKGQLKPGGTYDLPIPVVKFLNKLAVPVFSEVQVNDGSSTKVETQQVAERNRFSCQIIDL